MKLVTLCFPSGRRSTNRGEGRLGNVAGLAPGGILNFGESKGGARAIWSFAHDLMRCDNQAFATAGMGHEENNANGQSALFPGSCPLTGAPHDRSRADIGSTV